MKKINNVTNWLVSTTTGFLSAALCNKLVGDTGALPVSGMVGVSAAYGTHIAIDSYNDRVALSCLKNIAESKDGLMDIERYMRKIIRSNAPEEAMDALYEVLLDYGFTFDENGNMSLKKDSTIFRMLNSTDNDEETAFLKSDVDFLIRTLKMFAKDWDIKLD